MAESIGHGFTGTQSLDTVQHMQSSHRDMSLQKGMGAGTVAGTVGSSAHGNALRYNPDDVNAMIAEREKNFFAEVSLNPQLKDQHPLMHLITSQQKPRMVTYL